MAAFCSREAYSSLSANRYEVGLTHPLFAVYTFIRIFYILDTCRSVVDRRGRRVALLAEDSRPERYQVGQDRRGPWRWSAGEAMSGALLQSS